MREGPIRAILTARCRAALGAAVFTLCLCGGFIRTLALTDEDVTAGFRIPLTPPGARAAAMGGAQAAEVADVTAAFINPARLAALEAPELMGDIRTFDFASSARTSGLIQFDPGINPFAGSSFAGGGTSDSGALPAFLGYAHPLETNRPVVLSVSRIEMLDASIEASSENRTVPLSAPVTPIGGDEVQRLSTGKMDVKLSGFQVAAGWRLSPAFSVGGALLLAKLDLSSQTTGLLADPLQFTGVGMTDPRYGGPTAEPLVRTRASGSDSGLAFVLGTAWKPLPSLTLATVYRRGPEFTIDGRSDSFLAGTSDTFDNFLKVPDVSTLGVSWRPLVNHPSADLRSLKLVLDIERVEYGDILDGFQSGQNILTSPDFVSGASYGADDATEVRLGAEYQVSLVTWTLSLRGGVYTDHGGGVRFAGSSGDVGALQGQSAALADGGFFEDRDTEMHATVGAGAGFYSFSIDVALDHSEPITALSLSASYKFR